MHILMEVDVNHNFVKQKSTEKLSGVLAAEGHEPEAAAA